MIGRTRSSESDGFPCFDLLIGWLLWGMRNARAGELAPEPQAEVIPLAPRELN